MIEIKEKLKQNVEILCKELDPFKHIQALDYPRMAGTDGEKRGIAYIKTAFKSAGYEPKIQNIFLPPKSKIRQTNLPFLITTWSIISFLNAFFAPVLGVVSYLIAGLVLLAPLFTIISILKLEKLFRFFMRSSRKRIKSTKRKIEQGTFTGEVKTSQNVWIEHTPSQYEKELIICSHHDSVSMKISMKLMVRMVIIGAGAGIIYSFSYFIGFLLLFLQINIFQVFWWAFLALLLLFVIFLNLVFISRIFRTNESHGSCDDGTGVAIILELAKAIEQIQPKMKITLACFGAEEIGLYGSAAFYDERENQYQAHPVEVVSVDMIGEKAPLTLIESIKPLFPILTAHSLNEELYQVADQLEIEITPGKFLYPGSDFVHWLLNEHDATWLMNSSRFIHSKNDKPENINQDLLNQCLKLFVGLLFVK